MPSKVASELRERLAALLASDDALQRERFDLMQRIRQSLVELRAQHSEAGSRALEETRAASTTERLATRFGFTRREAEVALLLAGGSPNAAIAHVLGISEHTARHHTRHVLLKLGLHSRARAGAVVLRELAARAVDLGLIEHPS
ncbi:MAG TPA: LuxR C-terminal-related transcriptional regulator [Gemmatimonadales bacterium]|nr:LuxR C-terminal-related transcriptional regulator [Gemmatimonadales bacterium]